MMNLDIKHLSGHITPTTAGIIWLTDKQLNFQSPGIYEFNYLLNGILLKTISQQKEEHKKPARFNFFLAENFGNPFFIGHIIVEDKDDLKKINKHFEAANSFLKEGATIYIYNKSQNTANTNVLKELSKKYPQYEFENLNI